MKVKPASVQPMAIPLKLDHFRFRRQAQLEAELAARPLFKRVDAMAGKDWRVEQLLGVVSGTLLLPKGTMPMLDAAVRRLKTVARLSYPVRLYLRPDAPNLNACLGFLDAANTLHLAVVPRLLRGSVAALTYHLAAATYSGLQHYPHYLALLLVGHAPFELGDRLTAYEILRLNRHAANCFALLCCGSFDVATRECFAVATGVPVNADEPALNLDFLAEDALRHTAFRNGSILDDFFPLTPYEPLRPLVLRRFMASEPYYSYIGEPGGTPRDQFETEVLELDRQAYPPLEDLPADHLQFSAVTALLAAHWVLEATGPVVGRRKDFLQKSFKLEKEEFQLFALSLGWQHEGQTNTRQLLDSAGSGREWKNLHCVHILQTALRVATEEHNGQLPDSLKSVFADLGRCCQLSPNESAAVCDYVQEEAKKEAGESE